MLRAKYIASFIGHKPGRALFVGIYSIGNATPLTLDEYWQVPEHLEMKKHGMSGFDGTDGRKEILRFDLARMDLYKSWKGKLIVLWPPPERSWWRRSHKNEISIHAILEESALDSDTRKWNELALAWNQLGVLPQRLRSKLREWRGIYYIFDKSDNKAYAGSAYGAENLLGRWQNYADSGHGGNALLRGRDPQNFSFSILQLVAPDMEPEEVIKIESTWKERLNTRSHGLNDN